MIAAFLLFASGLGAGYDRQTIERLGRIIDKLEQIEQLKQSQGFEQLKDSAPTTEYYDDMEKEDFTPLPIEPMSSAAGEETLTIEQANQMFNTENNREGRASAGYQAYQNKMRFWIWTSKNPFNDRSNAEDQNGYKTKGAEVIDPLTQRSRYFDPSKKTMIMTHGFNSNPTTWFDCVKARQAKGDMNQYNMIALDWRDMAYPQLAWSLNTGNSYDVPAMNVVYAGKRAARMLLKLLGNGYPGLDKVHLVGHSLGAHVSGNFAREITKLTRRKIPHITALDQAGPKFVSDSLTNVALKKSDATYIDALSTNGALNRPFLARGYLGNARPEPNHATFYMNGGSRQPGCGVSMGSCSHGRAITYYAEVIRNSRAFKGYDCKVGPGRWSGYSWPYEECFEFKVNNRGKTAYIQEDYGGRGPVGQFVVQTKSSSPFSLSAWNSSGRKQ